MRKPSVKPISKVLVSFLSCPCNRTYKRPLSIGADEGTFQVVLEGFVVCFAVQRHGPADELTMTFLFYKRNIRV